MKTGKKIMSLLLVLVLIACMSAGALATESGGEGEGGGTTTGKIVINSPVAGQTYKIYKLFDLTYSSYTITKQDGTEDTVTSYAYVYHTTYNPWNGFFVGESAAGLTYVTIDSNGYVSWKSDQSQDDSTAAAFAQAALSYATNATNSITADKSQTCTAGDTAVVFDNIPLGYYLIDSTVGALCVLTSANPQASVQEKNGQPFVTKYVKKGVDESGNAIWGDWNSAAMGDTVEFKTVITAKAGAENYVLYDLMDSGFDILQDNIAITKQEADKENDKVKYTNGNATYNDSTPSGVASSDYTVSGAETNKDGDTVHTFKITFTDGFMKTVGAEDLITVTYSAKLTQRAVVDGGTSETTTYAIGNKNTTWMTYGTKGETGRDTTVTYTWQLEIKKIDSNDSPLAGAKFTLSTDTIG